MNTSNRNLVLTLAREHYLTEAEYRQLLDSRDTETAQLLADFAREEQQKWFGKDIYVRGLIEISSICRNDCLYCGLRCSNTSCERYHLSQEDILSCAEDGYALGFRTFVLQGGEDPWMSDERLVPLIEEIKRRFPSCAVTLSLGERSRESYARLRQAGADRYLLRHETASRTHYAQLHPVSMSFDNRMHCLEMLRELGYQVGCGFMVGSPYQTSAELAKDLKFVESFKPEMCGIGPFIPHHATPFRDEPAGSVDLTCFLLSILRLIHPPMLLPATTALATLHPRGREMGILAGANVVMPNLSPVSVRKKYELYDNKVCTGEESAECRHCLERRVESIGYRIVTARGDFYGESEPEMETAAG